MLHFHMKIVIIWSIVAYTLYLLFCLFDSLIYYANKQKFGLLRRKYRIVKITSYKDNRHRSEISTEISYHLQSRNILRIWKYLLDTDSSYQAWPDNYKKFYTLKEAQEARDFLSLREEKKAWKRKVEVVGRGEELGENVGIL